MTTKNFLDLLRANPEKELAFEYENDQFVPKAYHITEVKNVHIDSVDCGGRPDQYFQTIVQLWVTSSEKANRNMLAGKALKIFEKVDSVRPIRYNTPIFFEWGTTGLPTSNYAIEKVEEEGHQLTVKMFVPPTACKPRLEMQQKVKSVLSAGCCG